MSQPFLPNVELRTKPFLRWAGGKNWLVPQIRSLFPAKYGNYHEPFLGGGSIFFAFAAGRRAFLSDLNDELINAYCQIKKSHEQVIGHLDTFSNDENNYYRLRAESPIEPIYAAARFIFLNKTSYNGIYRVNRAGKFNVPYGHNPNAPIYDRDHLDQVSEALTKSRLRCENFSKAIDRVEKNDFVFLDPPYTVAHSNNGFIEYNQKLFTWNDQETLRDCISKIKRKGAHFILTNAVHGSVENLYKGLGTMKEVARASTITSQVDKRRVIKEFLITNLI